MAITLCDQHVPHNDVKAKTLSIANLKCFEPQEQIKNELELFLVLI